MELASRRSASTTTARCRRSNRTNDMRDRRAIDSLCARAFAGSKAETPKKDAPKLAQHWQLWPAPTEIDRSGTAAYIQAAWLATLVVTFVLVGGLPGIAVLHESLDKPLHQGEVPFSNLLQMVCIFLGLISFRWVPDDHNTAVQYWFHAVTGALATEGIYRGGWRAATVAYIIILLPIAEHIVGTDRRSPPPKDELNSKSFRFASLAQPVLQLLWLAWSLLIVAFGNDGYDGVKKLSTMEVVLGGISFGVYSGAFGITYAHELCHRHAKLDRLLGILNLVCVFYPHFNIEHNKGHHKMVATEEDPATARAGESFYHFLPRVVIGELRSAVELEGKRLAKAGVPFLHPTNELLQLFSLSIAMAAGVGLCLGGQALAFFLIQACTAVLLFESVNYLEHYGLERRQYTSDPSLPVEWRYAKIGLRHAWDSPTRLGNTILLKLQRHADHHNHAGKRYQQLTTSDASPQLPGGYATMIAIALVPPLWFAVMDPRLLEHRRSMPRQHYRHWPRGVTPPPPTLGDTGLKGAASLVIAGQRWVRPSVRISSQSRPSCNVCLDPERCSHADMAPQCDECE